MITCTRKLEFDAAHRVMNHESKCATIHGHRYVAEITAQAESLDDLGRVIDFSVLKETIGKWIDLHWDHTAIIFADDKETLAALNSIPKYKPVFVFVSNPTAENMADFLLRLCPALLEGTGVLVTKVRLYETPNCYAEATL